MQEGKPMSSYDPKEISKYADMLYNRANSRFVLYTLGGCFAGAGCPRRDAENSGDHPLKFFTFEGTQVFHLFVFYRCSFCIHCFLFLFAAVLA